MLPQTPLALSTTSFRKKAVGATFFDFIDDQLNQSPYSFHFKSDPLGRKIISLRVEPDCFSPLEMA